MASDTRNVKLGVCLVYFGGVDLGYTKGGVDVSVTTETHKVQVDQFGRAPINELVLGRELKVTVPLAETTIENMVRIMPGASLVQVGGTQASGSFTVASAPVADETITVNGVVFTFKASADPTKNEITIGADANATAANMRTKLNASLDPAVASATYGGTAGTVSVTYDDYGTAGNAFTLAEGTASAITVSGATLSGGVASTTKRVEVNDGVGVDLLQIAKELRLHPKGKAANDTSEDFVIPLAGTAGALNFAYKLEEERIFNVEFMGYPDSANNGRIFYFGN